MAFPLDKLVDAGVSIWLDDLSRVRLAEGGLDRLIRDRHVTGVTTNPTSSRRPSQAVMPTAPTSTSSRSDRSAWTQLCAS
jgi:hypothetical protein